MQRHLTLAAVLLAAACTPVKGASMNNDTLSISATCRNSPQCRFVGQDMFIDVRILNATGSDLALPLDYLRKRGPVIKLTDRKTGSESFTRPNLADPALQEKLTTLRPSESVILEWVIAESELRQFDEHHVDVTAEISIQSGARSEGREIEVKGRGSLNIASAKP